MFPVLHIKTYSNSKYFSLVEKNLFPHYPEEGSRKDQALVYHYTESKYKGDVQEGQSIM